MNRRWFLKLLSAAPVAAAVTPAIAKAFIESTPADGVALVNAAHPVMCYEATPITGPVNRLRMPSEISEALLPGLRAVFACAYEGHVMAPDHEVCTRCGMTAEAIAEAGHQPYSEDWEEIFCDEPSEGSLEDVEVEIPTVYGLGDAQ